MNEEQTNTTVAFAGATYSLLSALMVELVKKGVFTAEEALGVVQKTRSGLEKPQNPGGIRASVLLEPVEEALRATKRD